MNALKFALFGYPLGHTMSPFIHKKLFELNNINAEYEAVETKPEKLEESIKFLDINYTGCNLTIPHKSEVIPCLDELSDSAALYGAVNTVVSDNGKLIGHNTDCIGFLRALEHAGIDLKGKVLVCGAGGAARMMAFESAKAGCDVTIAVRESGFEKGTAVALEIKEKLGKNVSVLFYENLDNKYDIILNGTPAGMYPNVSSMPVNEDLIKNSSAVFDAVYNPQKTMFLKSAEKYGKKLGFGMVMLVYQAAAAQELWLNVSFKPDDIRKIIDDANTEMNLKFNEKSNSSIVLCGFMGCGKSTVGRILAEKLGYDFIDMDDYIEKKANKKIADIFKDNGESTFRALEHEACIELSGMKNVVIGSGGGALTFERNVKALKNCKIILLNVKTDILLNRLKNDSQPRPVLERAIKAGTVTELISERIGLYKKAADLTVDISTEQPPERIAGLIKIKI